MSCYARLLILRRGDFMIYKLEYKKIVLFLAISLTVIISLLWYKKEAANNNIPKRANYVLDAIDWRNANV